MSEVADRSRLLRSKKAELSGIVASRKRKLREFFAVCDNEGPIPQLNVTEIDAPPATYQEKHFLDVSDILQDRLFDESNLPTRRPLRSNTLKQRSPIRKGSPDRKLTDASRKAAKLQRDGSTSRKSRASTPNSTNDGGSSTTTEAGRDTVGQTLPVQRSTSKSSQTDLSTEASATLDKIVDGTFDNATRQPHSMDDNIPPANELEKDRIQNIVESPPNSPGADPRKLQPVLPETSDLRNPLAIANQLRHDPHQKAVTVHLPPKEVQEARAREKQRRIGQSHGGHLSINPPQHDSDRVGDMSSPGSTIGANSATTPALHEVASADTSPDNESHRYDADKLENMDEGLRTPKFTPDIDGRLKDGESPRIERSRQDALYSSPTGADNQLRLEEEAASLVSTGKATTEQQPASQLSQDASEDLQNIAEDQDEFDATATSQGERMDGVETTKDVPPRTSRDQHEVADSEASDQSPPVDAMDVDATTVKDSFESSTALASKPGSEQVTKDEKNSTATSSSSSPRNKATTPTAVTTTERMMTTRIASGAMRHKSVSEILGETPRGELANSDKASSRGAIDSDSGVNSSSPSGSATPSRVRSFVEKAKEKERSKLSTVIFPGRPNSKTNSNDNSLVPGGSTNASKRAASLKEDYLTPLFLYNASTEKRGLNALDNLISSSHKTITSADAFAPYLENQTVRILKRVYQLQNLHKWPLRQLKRSEEPIRPTSHWDVVLQEAKWMRTDFREERKWKMAVAKNLAYACAEWLSASPEDRKLLQVKAIPPQANDDAKNSMDVVESEESSSRPVSHPTPELDSSGALDSPMEDFEEEPSLYLQETVAPTAIFALHDDDVVFGLNRTPTSDKLLNELPMYGAPLLVPQSELPTSELDPDRLWKKSVLPVSQWIEGHLEIKMTPPPRKKSRFEYSDDEDDDDDVVFGSEPKHKRTVVPPEDPSVGLFNPEMKPIRDRIHAAHQFRPPSEFQMPQQSFFECRLASQWTWEEDNELKKYVADYCYNWSLISSMLSSKSLFSSGYERRTPWECFERWVSLEGLPADMQKTQYFRAYQTRIEAANRHVLSQISQVPQQPNASGQIPPPRKRTTSSIRVEKRRNQKHLTIVDAMRKLAKKRETTLQKAQHAAGLAAMRKANEAPAVRGNVNTPQDFSRMKHEREELVKERLAQYQQRQDQQRRAHFLQQQQLQQQAHLRTGVPNSQLGPQPNGMPNGGPQQQQRMPSANGVPGPNSQNLAVPGQNQNRPRQMQMPPQMAMQNGQRLPQMATNSLPSVPMHGIQGQLPLPNPALNVDLMSRAQNISQQQQAIRMQQQNHVSGQSPQMHNSPPRMNGLPQPGFQMPNPNMMPPFMNNNGVGTPPSTNNTSSPGPQVIGQGQSGSPRIGQSQPSGVPNPMQAIEQSILKQNPHATPEQVQAMVRSTINSNLQRHTAAQNAMNAAAGGAGGNGMNPNPAQGPQLYAQRLRQQQENQQKAALQQQQNANNAVHGQNQALTSISPQLNGNQGHASRPGSSSLQSNK